VIDSAVDAMVADQNTNIAEGLAWAWRVISPDEPFTEGMPYSDQKTVKAIILLTDGENFVSGDNTFSSYGFGDAENPQLGADSNGTLNDKTLELCSNVKADKDGEPSDEDIPLYTIAFNVSGPILQLLSDCATTPGHFFESPHKYGASDHFCKDCNRPSGVAHCQVGAGGVAALGRPLPIHLQAGQAALIGEPPAAAFSTVPAVGRSNKAKGERPSAQARRRLPMPMADQSTIDRSSHTIRAARKAYV
jgi:hypothetical protein